MNALEFFPGSSRFAPVRRLQTAGTHRGVHRDSVNEALTDMSFANYKTQVTYHGKNEQQSLGHTVPGFSPGVATVWTTGTMPYSDAGKHRI